MKLTLRLLEVLLLLSMPAWALQGYNGNCSIGNVKVVLQGMQSTGTFVASYPGCTVAVYVRGTQTLATIYADNLNPPTAMTNPFVASTTNGSYLFYAADLGHYDITMTGGQNGGFPVPYTIPDVLLQDVTSILASPPPIGNVVPNTGAFTSLAAQNLTTSQYPVVDLTSKSIGVVNDLICLGCLGNTINIAPGCVNMANGSPTLTINQTNCPGNSAVATDFGKSVYVLTAGTWGAGCGSGALKATIIGVTPPNQFTLSANACQTVTNGAAFYGTDNTAAINAYMQSTNPTSPFAAQLGGTSNGRIVHLPAGAYLIDTTSGGSIYTRRGMSFRGDRQTLTALWDMGTGVNSTIKMCSSTHGVDTGGSTCEIDGIWVATPFGGANAICVDDNGADVNYVEHMWFSCTGTGLKLTQGGTFVQNNTWDQGTRIAAVFVGNGNPASTNPFGSVNSIGNLIYATSMGGYVLQGVGSFNSVGDIFVANKCYDIEVNSGAYGACVDAPSAAGNTSYNVVVTGDRFQASTTAGYFAPQETHIRILTPLASSSITNNSFSESHQTDIYAGPHGQIMGLAIGPANTFLNDTSQGTSSIAIQYTDPSPSFGLEVKNNIWNSPACWALDSIIPTDAEGNYISNPFNIPANCGVIGAGEGGAIILAGAIGNSTLRNNRTDSASYAATAVAGVSGTAFISSSGNRAPNFTYDAIFNQGTASTVSSVDERHHNYAGAGDSIFTTIFDSQAGVFNILGALGQSGGTVNVPETSSTQTAGQLVCIKTAPTPTTPAVYGTCTAIAGAACTTCN